MIFSTYKFPQESLIIEYLAHAFFMFENSVVSNKVILIVISLVITKEIQLLKIKNIFLLKELIFTSPQLKITLFKTVVLQLALMLFIYTILANTRINLLKR
jgi:hypothetical protein